MSTYALCASLLSLQMGSIKKTRLDYRPTQLTKHATHEIKTKGSFLYAKGTQPSQA
jgi:hypothetical protein